MSNPLDTAKTKKQRENTKALMKFADNHSREEVAHALQVSDDPVLRALGDALTDRSHRRTTIALMARKYGASYRQIATCVFENKIDEGKVRMSRHLPQVMEDMAIDSLSRDKQCPMCDGSGTRSYHKTDEGEDVPEACKECNGSGLVRVQGDSASRKMVMEATGLTGKGVNVDARSLTLNVPDGLEDTLALVKKVRDVQREVQSPHQQVTIEAGGEDEIVGSD